jgi:MoxR-vWA-beta-propeller ternary system domain bpX2
MEKDSAKNLTYYLKIKESRIEDLAEIRLWENLKAGTEGEWIWIKDLTASQVESKSVRCIPFTTIYYEKDGRLYLNNSLLPDRNIPGVLWSPLWRVLPLQRPPYNHNYFGLEEKLKLQLQPSSDEKTSTAMMVDLLSLENYLQSAPEIRFKNLEWAVIGHNSAFVKGTPLLPLEADVFWLNHGMFLPAGFDFNYSILGELIRKKIDPLGENQIVLRKDGGYFMIPKDAFVSLSKSSFQLTQQVQKHNA